MPQLTVGVSRRREKGRRLNPEGGEEIMCQGHKSQIMNLSGLNEPANILADVTAEILKREDNKK